MSDQAPPDPAAQGTPAPSELERPGRPSPRDASGAAPGAPSVRSLAALERLRDRVEMAAHELKQLREENVALQARIRELEARPTVDADTPHVSLGQDPELLRRKVSGFIEAIDRYLENDPARD